MALAEQVRLDYMPVLLAQKVMIFCGMVAMCLSAMGLYSIVAFGVRMRSLEIGIRMALGARRRDVLFLFVRQGATLAFTGVAGGVVVALISTRLLANLLYGVKATDPAIGLCSAALMLVVALAASWLPASRAAASDPMQALRTE
jgi:putative ABC transport system permease protein